MKALEKPLFVYSGNHDIEVIGNEDWGDKVLYRLIKNRLLTPKYLLSGHMHYPSLKRDSMSNTIILNPRCKSTK